MNQEIKIKIFQEFIDKVEDPNLKQILDKDFTVTAELEKYLLNYYKEQEEAEVK